MRNQRGVWLAVLAFATVPLDACATIVRFETTLGFITVRLYDTATPGTVANFLNYVTDGDYDGTFIHRSVPGFVVQGGGYTIDDSLSSIMDVPADPPILNEPGISNLRGTIAMAKVPAVNDLGQPIPGGGPDSATNEWFFSLGDNIANLDNQNGGFTVFGRVVAGSMSVVDAIAALPRVNAGGAFSTLPVTDLPTVQMEQDVSSDEAVILERIVLPLIPDGDFNFDRQVTQFDYTVWRDRYGTLNHEADGNGDGLVNAADYTIWHDAFEAASASATATPEPGSLGLAALALLLASARRTKKA